MQAEVLRGFRSAIETLKQYKRSHLTDETTSTDLTKALYVDPKPGDATLAALKRPHHVLVLGRKGTGESTLFQRFQLDIREGGKDVSAYLDIKTLFAHAQLKNVQDAVGMGQSGANAQFALELCLWRSFITLLVADMIDELPKAKATGQGFFANLFKRRPASDRSFTGLSDIKRYIDQIDIEKFPPIVRGEVFDEEHIQTGGVVFDVNLSEQPGVRGGVRRNASQSTAFQSLVKNKTVAMQQFRVDAFIDDLRKAMKAAGINQLHLIVDDFSELPEEAMQLFNACILEPFDNLAHDIVKFKIGVYPGRISLGNVDRNRFEIIYLDPHRLFSGVNTAERDGRAIEFVKRVVTNRITHFCRCEPAEFFADEQDKVWEALYFASAANPRTLGYILFSLLEHGLERGDKITVTAIRKAAEAHYHERVDSAFSAGRFADEALAPRGTIHTQKDLLDRLRGRAHDLANRERKSGEPANFVSMRALAGGKIPVSHFRILSEFEDFLAWLELNGFVTKYADVTDGVGMKFSVYTFNYGLCQVFRLPWYGTSLAERDTRFYMCEELNFSTTVVGYFNESIEFVCGACGKSEPGSSVDMLRRFRMRCPHCDEGIMAERPTRRDFGPAPIIPKPELVLTEEEFELVALLGDSKKALTARDISPELDISPQQVGVKAAALIARGVVVMAGRSGGRQTYKLTRNAQASYDKIKVQQAERLKLEAVT